MITCRCGMCGKKAAGRNNSRRVYSRNGIYRNEFLSPKEKRAQRKLLRARLNRDLNRLVGEVW